MKQERLDAPIHSQHCLQHCDAAAIQNLWPVFTDRHTVSPQWGHIAPDTRGGVCGGGRGGVSPGMVLELKMSDKHVDVQDYFLLCNCICLCCTHSKLLTHCYTSRQQTKTYQNDEGQKTINV